MSYLLRGIAADGGIRVIAADTTALVDEARTRHRATPTAGAALGRTLTGALLLAHVLLKNPQDRVTVSLRGDGPLGGVIADAGLDGEVRGYVKNPQLSLRPREDGKLDVGRAVGSSGEIEVIRSHAPYGDPYSSSLELVTGEVAEDIAVFLARSEQINSAVLLGVYFENGTVAKAGGVVLQALPGADEAALTLLEANIRALGQLTEAMRRTSLVAVLEELCWGLSFELLTPTGLPLSFSCRCSEAKALDAIAFFSPVERDRMVAEDGGAEVVCHWCGEQRWIGADAIKSLSGDEIRCPECSTLWYRQGQALMVRENETCACGRPVRLPN
ncbi:MAG: Hsp33 family molecular chaperone HslO [Trueperaceae bacterium]|nr:MAG: Hsp33 family molecular chaperone HslO [Trueperaceae bacterium]